MGDETREIKIHERLAVLEKQFDILVPRIQGDLVAIKKTLDNGLKKQMVDLQTAFEVHCADSEERHKEDIEKRKEWRRVWMYVVRFIMVFLAAVGMGIVYIFADFVLSGRLSKFFDIIDGVTP